MTEKEKVEFEELNRVAILTPEECRILWSNLKNQWLNRDDNYHLASKLMQKLYFTYNKYKDIN